MAGVVLDFTPYYKKSVNDVEQVANWGRLTQSKVAFRVIGDSALPFALPGQLVLGGDAMTAADLDVSVGMIVAICDTDGEGYLKRVGAKVPGVPYARCFEAIGGLGDSLILYCGPSEKSTGLGTMPRLHAVRPIIAVIYDYPGKP